MKVVTLPIGQVHPYPNNPRRNDAAVPKVARSLQTFGWRQPIVVDEDHVVIVGHTRLKAAQQLGMTEVPVHVATGLSRAQVAAYRLADNRTGEEAEWDDEKLTSELLALKEDASFDLALTGFDADEITAALAGASSILPGADVDDAPPLGDEKEAQTRPGDVLRLGRHRLVCGDSTEVGAWERLLGDRRADAIITDPPYGVSYVGGTKEKLTVLNDGLRGDELTELLRDSLSLAQAYSRAGAPWYVFAPHGPQFLSFATVGVELGWWRQTIVWHKDAFVLGRSDYHGRHEPCLVSDVVLEEPEPAHEVLGYGWEPGGTHQFYGGRKQDTVWECPRPRVSKLHPTMKPVALLERAIRNSTKTGQLIVDCFGSSGSTLLAAEVTGREARLIELSRSYCDVIRARWEEATGISAVLE